MLCGTQVATCHTSFIGGSCWMLISLTEDLKEDLITFNSFTMDTESDKLELRKKLSQYILYHTKAC